MRFERLKSARDARFSEAMGFYRESFPRHEQREDASQRAALDREAYQFNLIYDGDALVGILLCWEAEAFIYVEHFCIRPELRNRRYGQRALALLNGRGKTVILEIDPPVDETSIHRKGFYERAGYHANGFAHVHPPYHRDCAGHSLVVMSSPAPLTEGEYAGFKRYLDETVMGC